MYYKYNDFYVLTVSKSQVRKNLKQALANKNHMVEILTSIRIFVTNYTDHSVKHLYPAQIKFWELYT